MARACDAGLVIRVLRAALRVSDNPWAVAAAARAVLAAGLIAVTGVLVGDLAAVSVAYLGAACSVAFVVPGVYRFQATALAAQGSGACLGICVGALTPHNSVGFVAVAAAAGVVSGMVGALGPSAPGFGMMLSIGVAFGQFGGSMLSWWQQALWYLTGTAAVAAATLAPWLFRRGLRERDAVVAVLLRSAELCEKVGTPEARAARDRLTLASAQARGATHHPRAQLVSYAAAALYADGRRVPTAAIDAIRQAADQVAHDVPVSAISSTFDTAGDATLAALADALAVQPSRPGAPVTPRRRLRSLVRGVFTRAWLLNGVRLGLCMGVATGLAVALRLPAHAFWLPLTVAVIVRPEYASVFVRTVNRIGGTILGALVAASVLAIVPVGIPIAAAAALALGFAVASAPKLYGLSVIGVTTSALLATSITRGDDVLPAVRLLDTLLGACVAVVFGYLLWPNARRLPSVAHLDDALRAARVYLADAVTPGVRAARWQADRDDAYRLAHQASAACQRAMAEPPPVSTAAGELLPSALEIEDVVDAITAVASQVDAGVSPRGVADLEARLAHLDAIAARAR